MDLTIYTLFIRGDETRMKVKVGIFPLEETNGADASTIAHATVIGAGGSVNNPDCLPARSRGGTSAKGRSARGIPPDPGT